MNWLKKISNNYIGYKIVAYNGQRAYSLYSKEIINLTLNSSASNIYLGTSKQFCIDFYSGLTDDHDLLLTYKYNKDDVISGDPDSTNGEIQVRTAILENVENLSDNTKTNWNEKYPIINGQLNGLSIIDDIPNTSSISASLNDWYELPGVREVSFSYFDFNPKTFFYAANDWKHSRSLQEQIKNQKVIKPLIVVEEQDGPYILEGSHRFISLYNLGYKSFPAMVVIERS